MKSLLLLLLLSITMPTLAEEAEPKLDFIDENHGIGVALVIDGGDGIGIFYDYNIDYAGRWQLHLQSSSTSDAATNIFGFEIINISKSNLDGILRKVWSKGFYVGVGLGLQTITLDYVSPTDEVEPASYEENALMLSLDGGWQGDDGYYFSVGLTPRVYISGKKEVKFDRIPDNDSEHRSTAEEGFADVQDAMALSLRFGWYLD